MPDLAEVLEQNRRAVEDLLAASERVGGVWTTPRAPGKWSPAQVVEHVACALEQSAHVIAGRPAGFPRIPRLFRPLLRVFFFDKILRNEAFPGGLKTNRPLDPAAGPATPGGARGRVEGALRQLEQAAGARGPAAGRIDSTVFGRVTLEDYVRFQAIHTRHHSRQLVPPGTT